MIALLLAATAAATTPPLTPGLEPLAFLVGHCWRGAFPGGQADTHCFEPVFDGKHIRDRHEVTGGKAIYRGETMYSWNAESGRVDYVYWNSLGGVSRGTMVPKAGVLDFGDQSYTGPDGKRSTIKTEWRPSGDSFQVVSVANGVTGGRVVTYRRVD